MTSRIPVQPSLINLTEQNPHKEVISLNDVVRQVLKQQVEVRSTQLVMRCQSLPVVEAYPQQLSEAFQLLLYTILPQKWREGKLFLHIDCEEVNKDVDAVLTQGYKRYLVHIHTNITTSPEWITANKASMEKCSDLLENMDASFTLNEVLNTGCLFSISLLGKL
jgi:hypothetical protein